LPGAVTPIRLGRKRAAYSLLGPILLVGVLAPLFIPIALAYLEQPFSGTAANSGSIRLLFHLNESSGTSATDASSYANTGTLTNFPASPWSGTALNFDGVDDFVSVASAANLNLTTALSLEAWVNITNNNPANPLTIVSKWDDANGRRAYLLRLGINRKVQFLLSSDGTANPGSLFTAASAAALTINTWYHVSATYDGTTMRILINGVQDGTLAGPASVFASPALLRVGARGNAVSAAENFFVGAMDEPRVLDYARTDYAQLHIYHFNESGTTPPGDVSGYNNAAALVAGPVYTSTGARFGNGLSFNGTTQHADALYIGPDASAAALTMEAWITTNTVAAGARTIMTSETGGSTDMKLRLSGANVQFLIKTTTTTTLTSTGTVSAGALTHVAGTWDGATMRIFINGAQDPTTVAKVGSINVNRTLMMGAGNGPTEFFNGTIDEVRLLRSARTAFNAGAVVNEIALSPPSGNQWIEIYNGGGATLNLAGWVFKNTSDSSTYTVPASGTRTITPGAFVVIELGSGTDTATTYFTANDPGNSLLSGDLAAGGDSLSVYPNATINAANIIDFAGWGTAPSNAANGVSAGLWARGTFVGVAPTAQTIGLLADGNDDEGWKDWGGLTPMTKGASNVTATAAGVMALHAKPVEGGVLVGWATALEPGHVGFNIYRAASEAGPFEKVNGRLILGRMGSPFGGSYSFRDPQGSRGDWYQLEDLDTAGLPTRHPPVQAGAPAAAEQALLDRLSAPARVSAPLQRASRTDSQAVVADSASLPSHLNLPISATGLYRLSVDQLRAVLGATSAKAADFVITDSGVAVPVRITGATGAQALQFFATASEEKYSTEHVYQVRLRAGAGRARLMRERPARVVSQAPPLEEFAGVTRADENRIYFIGSPEPDLFFRDIVFSEQPAIAISLSTAGLPGPARLRGDLVGMTEAPDVPRNHHVRIRVNGVQVYDGYFAGVESHRFDVPLSEGLLTKQNSVEFEAVADVGSPVDVFLVNWVELESPQPLQARANRLEFSAPGGAPVRLKGFTQPEVSVLDVTRARAPVALTRIEVRPEPDGTYSALFQDGAAASGPRRYLAVAGEAIAAAPLWLPPSGPSLREASRRADYLVLTLPEFASALAPLLELRREEGLEAMLVDVEAVYDQFGFGNKSPEAIRDFIKATASWSTPPRYLLLAGGASFDPKGFLGTGWRDRVPTKLFRTRRYHYEAADDGFFVSTLPAKAGRIAIGRLPAQSAPELAAAVAKIVEFETLQSSRPQGRALFVADDKNARNGLDDPTFEQTSARLAAGLDDTGVDIRSLALSASPDPRADLLEAVRGGVDLINFLGHGGVQAWTSQGILTSSDAGALPNGPGSYFTVFSMTCFDGAFTYPYGDSLAWSLVKEPGRGAVAAYSPSTMLDPLRHADLDRMLLEGGFRDGGEIRLGDLIRRVESVMAGGDAGAVDAAESFNLIGDPALRFKWSER